MKNITFYASAVICVWTGLVACASASDNELGYTLIFGAICALSARIACK